MLVVERQGASRKWRPDDSALAVVAESAARFGVESRRPAAQYPVIYQPSVRRSSPPTKVESNPPES
jgi:hypothetical protein